MKAKKAAASQRTSRARSKSAERNRHAANSGGGPRRLGFPVKVLGGANLKSNDTRRWQQSPHLSVSLGYLHKILDYLAANDIRMYRMSSDIAPYATHPDMPQFHGMVRECAGELRDFGRRARELDIQLSFHPSQFIVLNSPDPMLVARSIWDLSSQAEMLDLMEAGPEAVMVVHAGGAYGDRDGGGSILTKRSRRRFAGGWCSRMTTFVTAPAMS